MKTTTVLMSMVLSMVMALGGFAAAGPQDPQDAAVLADADNPGNDPAEQANAIPGDPNAAPPEADLASAGAAPDSTNTFLGTKAGFYTWGHWDTFVGFYAGYYNLGPTAGYPDAGCHNTFTGNQAGFNNTTGCFNTFVGDQAGWLNTGPSADAPNGGSYNTFLGSYTGICNVTGARNTFVGDHAGWGNGTGSKNTCVGWCAGLYNYGGSGNVFIGSHAGQNEQGSNRLYIANSAQRTLIYGDFASTKVGIDTTSPTETLDVNGTVRLRGLPAGSLGRTVQIDETGKLYKYASSRRYKTDIETLAEDASQVLDLRPVRFRWQSTGQADIGLIAEEVAVVLDSLVIRDAEGRPEAVQYDKVPLYLLSVIKAQQERIAALEAAEKRHVALAQRIEALEQALQQRPVPVQQAQ